MQINYLKVRFQNHTNNLKDYQLMILKKTIKIECFLKNVCVTKKRKKIQNYLFKNNKYIIYS